MTTELTMLAWTAAITMLMWLPYILAHIANVGPIPALTYRADGTPLPDWAARAKKAHYNAIENLIPFAALVGVAHLTGATGPATATAVQIYFWARVAHYLLYTTGVPFGRTVTFAVSWLAALWIFWEILTVSGAA